MRYMVGSNPHPAPPGGDVVLVPRLELGVQRVHLHVALLLLMFPLPHSPGKVQIFHESERKEK